MKEKLYQILLLSTIYFLLITGTAFAGACSGHGGVSCSAGNDSDGSVICNDGWTGSSVDYVGECSGSSSSSSTTTYDSTPEPSYEPIIDIPSTSSTSSESSYDSVVDSTTSEAISNTTKANINETTPTNTLDVVIGRFKNASAEQVCFLSTLDDVDFNNMTASEIEIKSQKLMDKAILIYNDNGFPVKNEQDMLELSESMEQLISTSPNYNKEEFGNDILNKVRELDCMDEETLNNLINPPIEQSTSSFSDVKGHKFSEAIAYVEYNSIVDGYTDNTYQPDNIINRAEFTKIIIKSIYTDPEIGLATSCFPDVTDQWFSPYVCKAKSDFIIDGYSNGYFLPANTINLAEALKIIFEAYGEELPDIEGQEWYTKYINKARLLNVFEKIDSNPSHKITRGEMAQIIYTLNSYYITIAKSK